MNHNKITNVTDGEVSPTSKEAINGSQLYEATKEVRDVSSRVERLDDRVDKVGAHAAALAAFYPLDFDRGNKLDLAVGTGSCRGNTALAIGAFYRPDNRTLLTSADRRAAKHVELRRLRQTRLHQSVRRRQQSPAHCRKRRTEMQRHPPGPKIQEFMKIVAELQQKMK